jgi:hypothetical protein
MGYTGTKGNKGCFARRSRKNIKIKRRRAIFGER